MTPQGSAVRLHCCKTLGMVAVVAVVLMVVRRHDAVEKAKVANENPRRRRTVTVWTWWVVLVVVVVVPVVVVVRNQRSISIPWLWYRSGRKCNDRLAFILMFKRSLYLRAE